MVLPEHCLLPLGVSFGPHLHAYWLLPEVQFPPTEGSNTGGHRNTKWPLILIAAKWSVSPATPTPHRAIILHDVVPRTCPHAGLGTRGVGAVVDSHLQTTTPTADHPNTLAYVNRFCPFGTHS